MGIGNLNNKVSDSDIDKMNRLKNPPEYEPGFEDSDSFDSFGDDDSFADLFSDDDIASFNSGGSSGSSDDLFAEFGLGGNSGGSGTVAGNSAFSSFGNTVNLGQSALNPMGTASQPKEPGLTDKLIEVSSIGAENLGHIIVQMVKSTKLRTADDWGYYGKKLMDTGIIMAIVGVILWVLFGICLKAEPFKLTKIPLNLVSSALICFGTGLVSIGLAAYRIDKLNRLGINNIDSIDDIPNGMDDPQEDYEDDIQSMLDGLYDTDDDFFNDSSFFEEDEDDYEEPVFDSSSNLSDLSDTYIDEEEPIKDEINFEKSIENVQSNVPLITRQLLMDTFIPLFPLNTQGFSDRKEIDPDSREFITIESLCMEALASAGRMESEDLIEKHRLQSAYETFFTYELKVDRVKGLNKLEDISREMVAYFRESSSDTSVSCKVDLEGKMYKMVLSKGVSAVITYGDLFSLPEVKDYFKDRKRALPIIAGISDSGEPILTDAKMYDTMLIAGKPRSGKSWYVLNLMLSMMAFNTPDDVQFLIIDPKESNLFKTLALMPHVCGLHNDKNILNILRDLIENEGARRKKMLSDNKCENIWDLREKGIMLPVLYIVIDEVMTVIANLDSQSKTFFDQIKVIVSQLPSQGIRLIMVPHRSQGVVDKTIRTNIGFTAAVRAEPEVIKETLDIRSWDKPLLNPGDTALKMQGFGQEMFVHGPAVTTSDSNNTDLIITIARMFYKMGVEIPDMGNIGCGYNRNNDYIKEELGSESMSMKVQFDINDTSDVSLDNLEDE